MATDKPIDEYQLIRDLILSGEVMPNERLVEMDYAKRFNTNRASIRSALARLEQDGLVVSEPYRGAHVRNILSEEAIEIFEVRGALEVLLVPRAVERATKADKELLKKLVKELRGHLARQDAQEVGLGSRRIREQVWRISEHGTGTRILQTLNTHLVRLWYKAIAIPGRTEEVVEDLSSFVDALCDGDTEQAVRAMRRYHKGAIAAVKKATARGKSGSLA